MTGRETDQVALVEAYAKEQVYGATRKRPSSPKPSKSTCRKSSLA